MPTYRREGSIIALGKQIKQIHAEAAKKYKTDSFLLGSDEGWVKEVNAKMRRFPELITLRGRAERAFAAYADGLGEIDFKHMVPLKQLGLWWNMAHLNIFGVIRSIRGIMKHGGEVADFVNSSRVNTACDEVLKNYALVSVVPKGIALVRAGWSYYNNGRTTGTRTDAGIAPNRKIKIAFGGYREIKN